MAPQTPAAAKQLETLRRSDFEVQIFDGIVQLVCFIPELTKNISGQAVFAKGSPAEPINAAQLHSIL